MKTLSIMSSVILMLMITIQLQSQTENSAVISADKMNVFYRGIDNPISIAVPGVTNDKIKVSITNGTIRSSNGKYIVSVFKGPAAVIDVFEEIKPGENKKVGSCSFRILNIPAPLITLGNYSTEDLYISKNELIKNAELNVSLNLPFEIKFEIKSFSFVYRQNGDFIEIKIVGNKFNTEILNVINTMKAGSEILINDINVLGPDGTRTLPPINIHLVDKE
jgi:gliding motility-associated protein GldM